MELLNFMNAHPDWKTLLAAEPYHLDIREDEIDGEHYFLLKYNMILSDMSLREVQEARGSIFRQNEKGYWVCVCRGLDKFGNYGESYAVTNRIDWSQPVSVQSKMDGSIIKCYYDRGKWLVATNNTIDAFKAECGDSTFGDVFYSIIERFTTVHNFFNSLGHHYTYYFEMIHPLYNHIVVRYDEPAIYFLGCRNMITLEEHELAPYELPYGIRTPQRFNYHSLAECIAAAHKMGDDEEGYVVCAYNQMEDDSFLRIKIKGDEYLRLHKMRGNGPLTVLRVVEMYQQGTLDDFIAYYPEFKDFTDDVIQRIRYYIEVCDTAFKVVQSVVGATGERRDFAMYANTYKPIVRSFLYARLDGKVKDGNNYLMNMRPRTLASYIAAEMNQVTIGANEEND